MARILQQQPQQQHNHHEDSFAMENDDDDDCYEDLPPKQIWTTRSSASSEISPLREKQSRIQARQIIMGKVPALCTPDSTQTTTEDTTSGEDDDEGGPTTLGIAAAPFYGNEISNPSVSTFAEETSTQHDDDDISSSIPSFNTRRMILDLQDELARTKAELEHLRCGMPAEQLDFDAVSDNSTHAVVVEESELQLRFQKSEQRVVALQDKLKESHSIARRLHGTLRTVQKRMQHYALADLQCAGEDVVFMESIANLLALCFLVAPFLLFHWNDVGLFALLIGVTLAAVEIAIRP